MVSALTTAKYECNQMEVTDTFAKARNVPKGKVNQRNISSLNPRSKSKPKESILETLRRSIWCMYDTESTGNKIDTIAILCESQA